MSGSQAVGVAPSPWNARQRLVLVVLLAVGVVGLSAGYARDVGDASAVPPGGVAEPGRGGATRFRGGSGAVPDRRAADDRSAPTGSVRRRRGGRGGRGGPHVV